MKCVYLDDGEWSAEFADDDVVVVVSSWFCGEILPAKIFNEFNISIIFLDTGGSTC